MFRTNPYEFLSGVTDGTYNPGTDGAAVITVPELLGFRSSGHSGKIGGNYGKGGPAGAIEQIALNIAGTGYQKTAPAAGEVLVGLIMPTVKSAGIGIGFKLGKRLTRAPRAKLNRGLRQLGIGEYLRV